MTDEPSLGDWLSEHCSCVWSLLNNQARKRLPSGFVAYLSPPSEEQLIPQLAEDLRNILEEEPEGSRSRFLHQIAECRAKRGKQNLMTADEQIKVLIGVCGCKAVGTAYRRELSGVNTIARLAEILCEVAVCAAVSPLSSTPLRLHPPSQRPKRNTQCDVLFEVAGVRIYGEVKRYPDPLFREQEASGIRDYLRPIDLYSKLQGVPEQFPEGTVNLLFVYHRSLSDLGQALQRALFGWREARLRPVSPDTTPREEEGLFARAEWHDISGCCLCKVENGWLWCPIIWENPQACVSIPPRVLSTLSRGAV